MVVTLRRLRGVGIGGIALLLGPVVAACGSASAEHLTTPALAAEVRSARPGQCEAGIARWEVALAVVLTAGTRGVLVDSVELLTTDASGRRHAPARAVDHGGLARGASVEPGGATSFALDIRATAPCRPGSTPRLEVRVETPSGTLIAAASLLGEGTNVAATGALGVLVVGLLASLAGGLAFRRGARGKPQPDGPE